MELKRLDISWGSYWRAFFMVLLAIGLYYISNLILILFLAIVISSAMDAPLNYLEKRKIPRILGFIFIFLGLISIIAFLLYTLIPVVIIEAKDLLTNVKVLQIDPNGFFGVPEFTSKLDITVDNLAGAIFSGGFSIISLIPKIFQNVVFLFVVIFSSFYLAMDRNGVERFVRSILPLSYENYAVKVFHSSRTKIGKWLEGQIILSLIVAVLTFLGMEILGVKYSVVIGLLAGIFEIIPIVGPIIAGAFAFLIALSQSTHLAFLTFIVFVVVQQLENHLLVPLIMKRATGIHPVVVIFAILAGAEIFGLVGAVLSVPVVVVLQELVEDYSNRKYRQPTL